MGGHIDSTRIWLIIGLYRDALFCQWHVGPRSQECTECVSTGVRLQRSPRPMRVQPSSESENVSVLSDNLRSQIPSRLVTSAPTRQGISAPWKKRTEKRTGKRADFMSRAVPARLRWHCSAHEASRSQRDCVRDGLSTLVARVGP